jgi:hypothetical protein
MTATFILQSKGETTDIDASPSRSREFVGEHIDHLDVVGVVNIFKKAELG